MRWMRDDEKANCNTGQSQRRPLRFPQGLDLGTKKYASVTVAVPHNDRWDELLHLADRVIELPVDRRGMNPLRDGKLFRQYRAILGEIKPDLVLTYTIKPNIYGGLACRMAHIPYAVNITGLGSAIENGGWLKKFVLALYRPALKDAKVVFSRMPGIVTPSLPPAWCRRDGTWCCTARASIWRTTPASPTRRRDRCASSLWGA